MKVVIVGGVAGGATAAARIRRLDESADIVVFEKSGHVSYANCGLPYYIGGVIQDDQKLTLQTPRSFYSRFRVDVRVRTLVTAIHPDRKTVSVRELETGKTYEERYDKLLLSPGAKPMKPQMPGLDSDRLYTLRNVEDTMRIKAALDRGARSAVLAGGGFIGIELAENLRELGLEVTLIQRGEQLLHNLDADMAALIQARIRRSGIRLLLNSAVQGFADAGDQIEARLGDGTAVRADFAVLAIGVTPDTGLAKEAGLKLGIKDAILVNDRMETSEPDIYAVGDAVQIPHLVSGREGLISLAGPANKQGRIAADNICGGDSRYAGGMGSAVVKIFDLTAASTGLNEKGCRAAGLDYDKVVLSPASHATYYPGGRSMMLKVLFQPKTGRILGGQAVGPDGVDKRIDVLAAAIQAGMTAGELIDLDLCYAPPFSSAKDPVNMAGYMIENLMAGLVKQFHWNEVADLPRDGSVTLVDTRRPEEYAAGHVPGFINIPLDTVRDRMGEIDRSKPVYIMCHSGLRSYLACRVLTQNGYDCYNFSGGYSFYEAVTAERAKL